MILCLTGPSWITSECNRSSCFGLMIRGSLRGWSAVGAGRFLTSAKAEFSARSVTMSRGGLARVTIYLTDHEI